MPYDWAATKCTEEEWTLVGGTATLDIVIEKFTKGEAAVAGEGKASDNGMSCMSKAKKGDKASPGKHSGIEAKSDGIDHSAACEDDTPVTSNRLGVVVLVCDVCGLWLMTDFLPLVPEASELRSLRKLVLLKMFAFVRLVVRMLLLMLLR